jgi:hypothetical protein
MAKATTLCTLEIFLIGGPITEKFIKKNPIVSRTIQIRGDQTLEDLHGAIFKAFAREEDHMYEFQIGGKGPHDPEARCYGLSSMIRDLDEAKGDVSTTRIDSLNLKKDEAFGYWFDFGDDWWHQINVIAIDETAPPGKYPKMTARVGQSPPQYMDEDE